MCTFRFRIKKCMINNLYKEMDNYKNKFYILNEENIYLKKSKYIYIDV